MIATPAVVPTSIPSPSSNAIPIFGFDLRAYALCIMAGILLAIWLGNRRWLARGGEAGVVADVAVWAVPFGIIGGRLYHVITDNDLYFREGQDPWQALRIWEGGLGIWGAIAMGGLGVWIACRRRGVPFAAMADALAPGILLAQALGRVGNWFNQELYGRPTDLPWALEIDNPPAGYEPGTTFHPTFLYEALWAVALAFLLLWLDKRYTIGFGRLFALYVAGYTVGRGFWEYLRIDRANEIFGLRVNLWVTGLVFVAAVGYFIWSLRRHPGREDAEALRGFYDQPDPFDDKGKAEDDTPITLPDDSDDSEKPAGEGKPVGATAEGAATADKAAAGDEPDGGEKPAGAAKPADAATPADAGKPADGAEPADAAKPDAGEKPGDAAKPAGAAKLDGGGKPGEGDSADAGKPAKKTSAAVAALPAQTTASTSAAKKSPAKKSPAKKTAAEPAAKKTAATKTAATKAAAKKTAAKSTAAKKTPAKKAPVKKAPAEKAPDTPAQAPPGRASGTSAETPPGSSTATG